MPEASQRYAAFVSYRHMPRDRQWAIRVMRALEAYRTPAPLKREAFPDRIGHLFRDEDEIPASSDLSDQIKEALARSDYLIVICSPDTPGSRWVRREIELFQEMGKGERIIPLLIAGEPDESFPAELRRRRVAREGAEGPEWEEVEPIAADVRRRGDERGARTERCALLRLAAALLGCRYDDLARRDDARRRAIWRARALAAACVLLGVAGGGVWWWDAYWRVKTEYCANYAERFGVPECVGEITGDGWQHQYRSFRLTLRAGRVLELARVNGSGTPTATPETLYEVEPWTEGVARWTFTYDGTLAGGWPRLSRVTMLAPNGRQIRETGYHFTAEGRQAVAGFDKGLGVAERQTAAGTTLGSMPIFGADTGSQHSNIGQHRLFFDAGGRLSRRLFEPVGGGANIADAAGAYGRAYTYTLQGLIAVTRNLDTRGETLIDRLGGAAIPRDYDPQGRLVAVTWQDAAGHPRANDQNVATVVYSRNADGLVEVTAYRDQAGALALRNDWDVARTAQRYDQRGNLIEQLYFGTDGRSILRKDIGAARTATRYDERGNMVEQTYFGTDGQPILDKDDGATRETWRYDGNGNAIETAYFGTDGQPTPRTAWGATAITSRYDEDGNAIEEAYFGTDGKPILREDIGLARETWRYDERGNAIEDAYFGADGQPILREDTGAARITYGYDERGNAIEEADFGTDEQPILREDIGAARLSWRYDERGNGIEVAYFGTDGRPVLGADFGATRITSRYDERGNKIEAAYFGTDGQMILRKDIGVARLTWHYDERGGVVEEAYFGTDGQTILRKDIGAAVLTWRYDERGDRIEQAYFGTNGQPILRKDIGVARETWRYDERGNAIEEAYFGADGQPILRKDSGAARTTWRYDERRNEVEQTFFGGDGKPILSRDFAAARVIRTYDEAATLVESETFDVAGLELRDWFAGDDEQKRGDYVAALARYTAGLTRIARGATQEPTNIRGQLALADIHDRIANTRQAMNDRAGAAQSLTAETEILLALTQHQLDATSRDDVTERLGNHSYVLLFIGEDKKALDTADVAIALAPDKRWILTNKAHALMFLDQTEAARALYLAPDNRGREMPDGNTWEADITNDFAELRKAGRTNPLMDEVLRAFVAPPPSETAPP